MPAWQQHARKARARLFSLAIFLTGQGQNDTFSAASCRADFSTLGCRKLKGRKGFVKIMCHGLYLHALSLSCFLIQPTFSIRSQWVPPPLSGYKSYALDTIDCFLDSLDQHPPPTTPAVTRHHGFSFLHHFHIQAQGRLFLCSASLSSTKPAAVPSCDMTSEQVFTTCRCRDTPAHSDSSVGNHPT